MNMLLRIKENKTLSAFLLEWVQNHWESQDVSKLTVVEALLSRRLRPNDIQPSSSVELQQKTDNDTHIPSSFIEFQHTVIVNSMFYLLLLLMFFKV